MAPAGGAAWRRASTAGATAAPGKGGRRRCLALPLVLLPLGGRERSAQAASPEGRMLKAEELADVRAAVAEAIPKAKAPSVVRLAFHDAGTYDKRTGDGGANGTVRNELERPESIGLKRGVKAVEAAVAASKTLQALSFADAVQLCAAASVELLTPERSLATSSMLEQLRVGRADAPNGAEDPTGRLPSETADADALLQLFADQYGFDDRTAVLLAGAHTVGSKGFGDGLVFDNSYFKVLLDKPWTKTKDEMAQMVGLRSDRNLADFERIQPILQTYATDGSRFAADFCGAFVKLSELGVTWI